MRERISVAVSVMAAVVLVSLSAMFARSQNPAEIAREGVGAPAAKPSEPVAARAALAAESDSARGRAVFEAKGCLRCHSVAGEGNARNPLDGVGARRKAPELRAWTLGAEVLADSLPPSAYRAKQSFQQMPAAELDQLIVYLSSLKQPPRPE